MKLKAFTLAELLICVAVIAIIAAMSLPAMIKKPVDKDQMMIRKAYNLIEKSVLDMANDDHVFPDDNPDAPTVFAYYNPKDASVDDIKKMIDESGEVFCKNLADKLNTSGDINCKKSKAPSTDFFSKFNNNSTYSAVSPTFTSTDGMDFFMPMNKMCDPNFKDLEGKSRYPDEAACPAYPELNAEPTCPTKPSDFMPYTCIYVDVNGIPAKNGSKTEYNKPNSISGKNIDRFVVYVFYDGRIRVNTFGDVAKNNKGDSIEQIISGKKLF